MQNYRTSFCWNSQNNRVVQHCYVIVTNESSCCRADSQGHVTIPRKKRPHYIASWKAGIFWLKNESTLHYTHHPESAVSQSLFLLRQTGARSPSCDGEKMLLFSPSARNLQSITYPYEKVKLCQLGCIEFAKTCAS